MKKGPSASVVRAARARAELRKRVVVEHRLAHVGAIQGYRSKYFGTRKTLLDLRRTAVVANLHEIARVRTAA